MENEIKVYTPSQDAFKLTKVKLTKEGGLDVHYEETEVIGNEHYTNRKHVECDKDIHPDLRHALQSLKECVLKVFNWGNIEDFSYGGKFNPTEAQRLMIDEYIESQVKRIRITGIALAGKGENVGYVISFTVETAALQTAGLCTPRIKINDALYGIEDDLSIYADEIEDEVYKYLFQGKKAQLELFGDAGE